MEQEYRGDDIAIDSTEGLSLAVAHTHKAEDKEHNQRKHRDCPHKAKLLAYGAEDEVGMFLGYQAVADM